MGKIADFGHKQGTQFFWESTRRVLFFRLKLRLSNFQLRSRKNVFQVVCFLEDIDHLKRSYTMINSKYCNMCRMKTSKYRPFRNQQLKLQKKFTSYISKLQQSPDQDTYKLFYVFYQNIISLYRLPYNTSNVSYENTVQNQDISQLMIFFILVICLPPWHVHFGLVTQCSKEDCMTSPKTV